MPLIVAACNIPGVNPGFSHDGSPRSCCGFGVFLWLRRKEKVKGLADYKTKVDIAYDSLIEGILNGMYKPGDRIIISRVAEQNHMSEIPVREAIRRMESEGYLELSANHGAVVSQLLQGIDQIEQIFQIKGALEGFASRLSIDYLSADEFAQLRAQNQKMRHCLDSGALQEYTDLNMSFHMVMYDCIPQKMLVDMIRDLWKKWIITKATFKLAYLRVPASCDEHEQIIALAEEKKYDELEFFVRRHTLESGKQFVELLTSREKETT